MYRLLAVLFVLSLALPGCAVDDAKPNEPTQQEIAEKWISLFDGETTFGWKIEGEANVKDGALVLGGNKRTTATPAMVFPDCEIHADYQVDNGKVRVFLEPESELGESADLLLSGPAGSTMELVLRKEPSKQQGRSSKHATHSEFTLSGKTGVKVTCTYQNRSPDLRLEIPAGTTLLLRSIKLRPMSMKPLFNGKDLTGWKKFEADPKRAKSQFTVTEDGYLSIQNGPGDLQTTDEWADFVLQLDCRTNGDNLNSGVFLRCIPGQYQNGYEAQIQNQAAKKPKTYTIDEYDPKTNKLVTKKKIENWSQDFGTGSIYRRVPARRAVAKDREWFTMTVVARGRHFATWVNGIQVVDWTDNRPENENARNGCRLKKGPISLQGHDPTTDLSFRNIRIADLSEGDPK